MIVVVPRACLQEYLSLVYGVFTTSLLSEFLLVVNNWTQSVALTCNLKTVSASCLCRLADAYPASHLFNGTIKM